MSTHVGYLQHEKGAGTPYGTGAYRQKKTLE